MYFLSCNASKFTRLFTAHLLTYCAKKPYGERNFCKGSYFKSLVFLSELLRCILQIFFMITFLIIFNVVRVMSPRVWLDYQNLIVVNPPHFLLQEAIRFNGAVIPTLSSRIDNQFPIIGLAAYSGLEDHLTICIFIHVLLVYDLCSDYLYLHSWLEVS